MKGADVIAALCSLTAESETHSVCSPQPNLEAERCPSEEAPKVQSFKGSTALLFELEDKIAQAAADVQNTQSEVRLADLELKRGGKKCKKK